MNSDWIILCPECSSDRVVRDGDWLMCDRCGHRFKEAK